jgi:uncharacterized protein YkwD
MLWIGAATLLLFTVQFQPGVTAAALPAEAASPVELVAAVNNLRLAYGLPTLNIDPILTQTAQSQADALLATGGAVGHTRPNGITFTQQLLMLGYPLSGDLSLGGYRSENFIFGYQLSAVDAVEAWRGDEPHLNTMISPNRSDIGAGVAASADGAVYYVIDTALRTASGQPQSDANLYLPGGISGTPDPAAAVNQYIVPVSIATARPDGDVYHIVQYGQTLWSIAIGYGTKIDQIRTLNHLGSGTTVYPNQLLLVKQGATQPAPVSPTRVNLPPPATGAPAVSVVRESAPTQVAAATGLPESPDRSPEPSPRGPSASIWVALILLTLLAGAGGAAWFLREPASGGGPR